MNTKLGPYEGKAFYEAIQRLKDNPQLLNDFTVFICRKSRNMEQSRSFVAETDVQSLLNDVHNYTDFQEKITCDFYLNLIEMSSIDNFTFSGLEALDNKPHLYISNHRDIVLDTALLDLALYRSKRPMCEMVIGDNLLFNQFVKDMFNLNGAITVERNLSSVQKLRESSLQMSRYIENVILGKKKSVWIAQKSGRAKDGKDDTASAIIKMLYSAYREEGRSFEDFINDLSIVPVSISYQYDPCDIRKTIKTKKKYTDLVDIMNGLRLYKGNVHIQFGSELTGIANPRDAVGEIDRQIHSNYRLWDTNYYCCDLLSNSSEFCDKYAKFNTKSFDNRLKNQQPWVVDFVLNSYANPVRSFKNEKDT